MNVKDVFWQEWIFLQTRDFQQWRRGGQYEHDLAVDKDPSDEDANPVDYEDGFSYSISVDGESR